MQNTIPATQNTPEFLRLMYATSQAYSKAKEISGWQTILAVAAAVLGPTIAAVYPDAAFVGALVAVVAAIIDAVFLEPAAKRYQDLGARIQEVFDTDLLQLPWNTHRAGPKPTPEEILRLAEAFKKAAKPDALKQKEDWYPIEVGPAPLEYARLICQRASMRWDASLRKYYVFYFIVAVVAMLVGALLYGVFKQLSLVQFVLAVVVPLLPAGLKLWREAKKHDESAAATERARSLLEGFWTKAIEQNVPPDELREESRRLQDELFDRRRLSPTVPEWLYASTRESHEQEMKYGSQKMVGEVLAKLPVQQPAP